MKARLTTWLSALLLFSAVFGVPAAPVSTYRATACYVYCEQRKDHAEQIAEAIEQSRPAARPFTAAMPSESGAGAALAFSLFQRPPPFLSV